MSCGKEKSGSPASDTGTTSLSHSPIGSAEATHATIEQSLQPVYDLPGISELGDEAQFFLAYHQQHITVYHYFMMSHAEPFIHREIIENAIKYEPLLHAVVGFAAYHYSLGDSNGTPYTFLSHYDRSVKSLLKSLQAGDRYSDAMLLTILQLATFEVRFIPRMEIYLLYVF